MADAGFGGVFGGEVVHFFSHVLLSSKLGESAWGEGKGTSQPGNDKELPTPQPCTVSSNSQLRGFILLTSEPGLGGTGRTGKLLHLCSVRSCLQVRVQPGIRWKFNNKLNTGRFSRSSLIQCIRIGTVLTRHSIVFMEDMSFMENGVTTRAGKGLQELCSLL